jgi:cytochrome c556
MAIAGRRWSGILSMALVVGATAVLAQNDPIASRRALERSNEEQGKVAAAMIKGDLPFDLDRAKTVFATFLDVAGKVPNMFPENSKTGSDTTAAPKIWDDPDGFKAAYARFAAEAKAAQEKVSDPASFKLLFEGVIRHCRDCHDVFRVHKT